MEVPTWGELIIAGAAIFAAVVAALTANHRMERQLDEESKRLGRQLDEESKRLGRQLAHDRRVHEIDELRSTLDESCEALAQATGLVSQARVHRQSELPGAYDAESAQHRRQMLAWEERQQAWHRGMDATVALLGKIHRLNLRFGESHAVTLKLIDIRGALLDGLDFDKTPDDSAHFAQVNKLTFEFVAACRPYVAVDDLPGS